METQEVNTPVQYDSTTEQYIGVFNQVVVNKFIAEGILELVCHEEGITTLLLNGREDFISGFSAGINEAKIGHDQYYADYNANPFSFSIGFEHYQAYVKKNKKTHRHASVYFCHGMTCEETGETYHQG
jgi:hypothetical protein